MDSRLMVLDRPAYLDRAGNQRCGAGRNRTGHRAPRPRPNAPAQGSAARTLAAGPPQPPDDKRPS